MPDRHCACIQARKNSACYRENQENNNYISEYDSECYGNYYSKNLSSEKMRTIGVIVENFTTPSLNFLELMADYFLSPYILYEKKENKSITQKVLLNFVNMKNEFNLVKIIFLFVDNF